MATTTYQGKATAKESSVSAHSLRSDSAYQAYTLLRITFTVAPIAFGIDKFFNGMVDWEKYLAPWINRLMPGTGHSFMLFVGIVEITAGLVVALKPRYGARSEEHTSELQSRRDLVCRLLLEKKKK